MPRAKTKTGKDKNLVWHRDKWYARFYRNGKEIRESLSTNDVSEARKKLKLLVDERNRLEKAASELKNGTITWAAAVGRFLIEAESNLSPKTLRRYEVSLGMMTTHFQKFHLHEINLQTITEYVGWRKTFKTKAAVRRNGEVSSVTNNTINKDLSALSQVFDFGIGWGVAERNPTKDFSRRSQTRVRQSPRYIATKEEAEKIASAFTGMFCDAVMFTYLTGARQDEVFSAKWSQVSLSKEPFKPTTILLEGKGSKLRTIELNPEAEAILKGLKRPPVGSLIFWHGEGENYKNPSQSYSDVTRAYREKNAEFPKFTFHDLRHAFAVNYLVSGGDLYDLCKYLGHSTIKMTELYVGALPGHSSVKRK